MKKSIWYDYQVKADHITWLHDPILFLELYVNILYSVCIGPYFSYVFLK